MAAGVCDGTGCTTRDSSENAETRRRCWLKTRACGSCTTRDSSENAETYWRSGEGDGYSSVAPHEIRQRMLKRLMASTIMPNRRVAPHEIRQRMLKLCFHPKSEYGTLVAPHEIRQRMLKQNQHRHLR